MDIPAKTIGNFDNIPPALDRRPTPTSGTDDLQVADQYYQR
jgi:hypothetical protein